MEHNWGSQSIYTNCKQMDTSGEIPGGCFGCYEIELVDIASKDSSKFDFKKYRHMSWKVVVVDNCEMWNEYGPNNHWCVPISKGPSKVPIYNTLNKNATSIVCGGFTDQSDCNRFKVTNFGNKYWTDIDNDLIVGGQWNDARWSSTECGTLEAFTCRNVAGYAMHFDFMDSAPWGKQNAVVKAKPVQCPRAFNLPNPQSCGNYETP
jgi:hypothetical protein